jgi:hypothetical protein
MAASKPTGEVRATTSRGVVQLTDDFVLSFKLILFLSSTDWRQDKVCIAKTRSEMRVGSATGGVPARAVEANTSPPGRALCRFHRAANALQ